MASHILSIFNAVVLFSDKYKLDYIMH